ncbi:MAG: hypothetical protein HY754_02060 [Nitrospirae bacterium]|nr:hypothetical protein [Nitrospirota bacterium]
MYKLRVFIIVFSLSFLVIQIIALTDVSLHVSAQISNRDEIIRVFEKAINLNEDIKRTTNKIPLSEYQKKRMELEKFQEEVLSPKIVDVVKLLSAGKDIELSTKFFNLLISYENSADEISSYSLAEVFLKNADLVLETFKNFNKQEQKQLYQKLEWGWRNITYNKEKSDRRIKELSKKLQSLKRQVKD